MNQVEFSGVVAQIIAPMLREIQTMKETFDTTQVTPTSEEALAIMDATFDHLVEAGALYTEVPHIWQQEAIQEEMQRVYGKIYPEFWKMLPAEYFAGWAERYMDAIADVTMGAGSPEEASPEVESASEAASPPEEPAPEETPTV